MLLTATVVGVTRAAMDQNTTTGGKVLADIIDAAVRKKGTRIVASECTAKLTHPRRNRWECLCADAGVKYYIEIDYVDDAPAARFCACCGAVVKDTTEKED